MATLTLAESRRLYSWWWNSHISPKNSKWLQENLADIDANVKIMIKLIEHHDADSFAQRAEMFYKNRPELIKLVEEFYRAYRALAERYDQATDALRQVHRKMAEMFPNGIPPEFSDEPSSGCSSTDAESHSLEVPHTVFAPDHLQNKLLQSSLDNDLTKTHSDENYTSSGENTMKQSDHISTSKCSSVQEKDRNCSECKLLQKKIFCMSKENQDLKNQILFELKRAEKAESEANRLKEVSSRIRIEKADALSQCNESKTRVYNLENEISCMQTDLEKLNNEMVKGVTFLNLVKAQSLSLERANQALISELDRLKQRTRDQETELTMKKEELEQLSVSLKDEQQSRKKDELLCRSIEKQLAECQEAMKHLTLEIRNDGEKMKDVQLSKVSLEETLQNIREENDKLTEEKFLSALKIINLQDEIISLRGLNEKLQCELNHLVEEKAAIQLELHCLKEDRNDLETRNHTFMEEVHEVNLNVHFLQSMVHELRDGNFELKEIIKKHEAEKQVHLLTLKHIETVSDKNESLEISISNANNEIERLRERIKTLEKSCYHLYGLISVNQAEKAQLLSHVEAFSKNMEKLSSENTFLENSLFDVNAELDGFKGRLKDMEQSCQSLCDEKSGLLSEKTKLISQVESIRHSLKNLESRYASLERSHSHLERERESTLQQVEKLQEMLKLEREEHGALIKSSNAQQRALVKQICLLQVESQQRREELELEQVMNAQTEIFILQRCLRDMKEGSTYLSIGTQMHQDTLRCTKKLIAHLDQECHIQEGKITSLMKNNKNLKEWVHLIVNLLKIDLEDVPLDHVKDEVLLHLILHEIKQLLHTISETHDEKQHLFLEKSVVLTLLEQFGAYVVALPSEKAALERESISRINELAAVKNENDELLKLNDQLREEVQVSNKREEALKAEVDILSGELSDLQQAHFSLQICVANISQENNSISEKKEKLEKENNIILSDVVALDCLALVLKSSITEKRTELQLLRNQRKYLYEVQKDLDEQIKAINENIVMLHAGSSRIMESLPRLENDEGLKEFQDNTSNIVLHDKWNIEKGAGMLLTEYMDLSETNFTLQSKQESNCGLCINHGDAKLDFNTSKVAKHEMESNSCNQTDSGYPQQENEVLKGELIRLQTEAEELRVRERYLTSALQNETDKCCDAVVSSAVVDIRLMKINAELLEVKVQELIKACKFFETSNRMQTKILQKEIKENNFTINELEEKLNALDTENRGIIAELKAFLLLLRSTQDDTSLLEECSTSQDAQFKSANENSPEPTSSHGGAAALEFLKLKDLRSKIGVIGKVMTEAGDLLELDRLDSAASFNSTWKEIAGLTSIMIPQSETSNLKCAQSTRDVQHDIPVNSSRCSNTDLSDIWETTNADEIIDQLSEPELCRTSEVSCSYQKLKAPLVTPDDDAACHQIEMEDDRCPFLELVAEKENVDKLLFPRKHETQKQWNRRAMEKLYSDGHRLLVLNACVKELHKAIEPSERNKHLTKSELNHVKAQLKKVEGTISKLIDTNSHLAKKVEGLSVFPDDRVMEKKGERSKNQRQITVRANKISAKIGRLELEMQKIQYSLLKTDEDCVIDRDKSVNKSAIVILKQYMHGRRDSSRQKKGSCGCMKPNADSDEADNL